MSRARYLASAVCAILLIHGCSGQKSNISTKQTPVSETIPKDVAGIFGKGVQGICTPEPTRSSLSCDVYNGSDWAITEVTFVVTWSPYQDDDKRLYRVPAFVEPLKTEALKFSLGIQLPPDDVIPIRGRSPRTLSHWSWAIDSAKGYHAK